MNLLVAVLVEVVGVLATAEQEMVNNKYEMDQMQMALKELDENGDEFITLEEFGKLMDKRNALLAMRELGVDILAIVEAPELIFGQTKVRDINQLAKRMIAELRGTVGQLNSKIKEKTGSKDKVNLKNFRVEGEVRDDRDCPLMMVRQRKAELCLSSELEDLGCALAPPIEELDI
ncbi:hypothetical protein AK812_SmicGene22832 [Symbiodinium microadriaticum]|uniref:EF-hand domain-containing protein n=1 Tax=Symbiodinium microadriaticum TaxID=2951 RepID=A0A1Q9DIW2_SYMMI|nr:hypothetical protein AK812_SmicGene22832 [Symbiodinium microadriaticum]